MDADQGALRCAVRQESGGCGEHQQRRRRALGELAADRELDALIVTNLVNIRYLTGFSGSFAACVLRASGEVVLLTDGRYTQQAAREAPALSHYVVSGRLSEELAAVVGPAARKIGFEPEALSWGAGERLRSALGSERIEAVPQWVERLRSVKDPCELDDLRRAAAIGVKALAQTLADLAAGMTERQIADQLERAMTQEGSDGLSFETIVACGSNTAEPHHHPTERAVAIGDFVKIDFGATVNGYHSDMTRTIVLGEPTPQQLALHAAVLAAQQAGMDQVRAGVTGGDIDLAARRVLEDAGYGEAFVHPTGHGVGLEIHEAPRIAPGDDGRIAAATPLTVEPGAYIPGFGGVRIEDLVVAWEDGCEILTPASRDLA